MSEYFLNEDELRSVCIFHNFYNFPYDFNQAARIKRTNRIIKDLLFKQPELLNEYNSFINSIMTIKFPADNFGKAFAGKIKLENFIEQIFTKDYANNSGRMNLFKSIFEKNPQLLNFAHDFIKTHNVHDDQVVYDFYFQALKSKKVDKSLLEPKEILVNIDSFHSGWELNKNKKKINAYLSNFPKDETLYRHIMQQIGEVISNSGALKTFWEDKLQAFPKDVQKEHDEKSVVIVPFVESATYYYRFRVNPQYIIEKTKIASSKAEDFCRVFHNAINDMISENYKSSTRIVENNNHCVSHTFEIKEERDEAQKFCVFIGQELDSLIKSFKHQNNYSQQYDDLQQYLEKLYMAMSLNKDLSAKPVSGKIKNKI